MLFDTHALFLFNHITPSLPTALSVAVIITAIVMLLTYIELKTSNLYLFVKSSLAVGAEITQLFHSLSSYLWILMIYSHLSSCPSWPLNYLARWADRCESNSHGYFHWVMLFYLQEVLSSPVAESQEPVTGNAGGGGGICGTLLSWIHLVFFALHAIHYHPVLSHLPISFLFVSHFFSVKLKLNKSLTNTCFTYNPYFT